jgi:hypothetical protein
MFSVDLIYSIVLKEGRKEGRKEGICGKNKNLILP